MENLLKIFKMTGNEQSKHAIMKINQQKSDSNANDSTKGNVNSSMTDNSSGKSSIDQDNHFYLM